MLPAKHYMRLNGVGGPELSHTNCGSAREGILAPASTLAPRHQRFGEAIQQGDYAVGVRGAMVECVAVGRCGKQAGDSLAYIFDLALPILIKVCDELVWHVASCASDAMTSPIVLSVYGDAINTGHCNSTPALFESQAGLMAKRLASQPARPRQVSRASLPCTFPIRILTLRMFQTCPHPLL
jgi:hypothetical protein